MGLEACFGGRIEGDNVPDMELLKEIKHKLDEARNLATMAGGFTLFYLIEIAILETEEMAKKRELASEAMRAAL